MLCKPAHFTPCRVFFFNYFGYSYLINAVKPHIVPFSFGDEPLNAGSTASITCTADEGDLPLSLSWRFHGKELSSQMGIETAKFGKRTNMLMIESVSPNHTGTYVCVVSNSAGQANHSTELIVRG